MLRKVALNEVIMSLSLAVFKIKMDKWKVELFQCLILLDSRG